MLLAIDPGTEVSGIVWLDGDRIDEASTRPNTELVDLISRIYSKHEVVIEMIASYGMPVGRETFETVVWIGRFLQAFDGKAERLYRRDIKLHFCGSARAKDANIWQAILDRFGGSSAIGNKKSPGPLYGVKSHARAALALGLAWQDGVRSEGLT